MILICPSECADARMRMFNADGSEAEMCGNGIRCVAKYVYDHGICRNERLRIETGAGVLSLELETNSDVVQRVRVKMGEPILEAGAASLTKRERELLSLLASGLSTTEEIADEMFISHKTVKNHLASIYAKLAVADRAQAAVEAIRLGLAGPSK